MRWLGRIAGGVLDRDPYARYFANGNACLAVSQSPSVDLLARVATSSVILVYVLVEQGLELSGDPFAT